MSSASGGGRGGGARVTSKEELTALLLSNPHSSHGKKTAAAASSKQQHSTVITASASSTASPSQSSSASDSSASTAVTTTAASSRHSRAWPFDRAARSLSASASSSASSSSSSASASTALTSAVGKKTGGSKVNKNGCLPGCSTFPRCSCRLKSSLKEKLKAKFDLSSFFLLSKESELLSGIRLLADLVEDGKVQLSDCVERKVMERLTAFLQQSALAPTALETLGVLLYVWLRVSKASSKKGKAAAAVARCAAAAATPAASAGSSSSTAVTTVSSHHHKHHGQSSSCAVCPSCMTPSSSSPLPASSTLPPLSLDDWLCSPAASALITHTLPLLRPLSTRHMASYILLHYCDGSRTATTFINTPGAIPALLDVYGSLGDAKDSAMLLELSSIITGICIKPTPQTLPRLQPIVPVLLSKFRSNSNPLLTAYICKALGRLCDGQKEIAESVLAANVSSYLLFLYWNAVDSERRRQQRQDVDDVLFEDIFGLLGLLAFYEKPQAQRLLAPLPTFPASAPFSLTPPEKEKKGGKESSASSEIGRSIVWSGVRRTDAEVYAEQDAVIAGYMKLQTAPDLVDIISIVLDLVLEPAEPASPPSSTDWYYVQCAAWQISMILTNGMAVRDSLHRRQRLINSLVFKKMLRCIDRHAAAMPSACLCALSQALSYSVLGASSAQIGYLVCEGLLHTLLLIAQHGKTSRKCLLCVLHAVNAILSMGERDRLPGRKGDVWDDLDGGGDGVSSDDDDDGDDDAWWGQDAQRQQSSDEEYVAAESEKRRKGEGDVVEERTRGVRRRRKREPERKSSRSIELPDERKEEERKDDQAKDAQQQRKQGRSRLQSQSLPQSDHPAPAPPDTAIPAEASPAASPSSSPSSSITSTSSSLPSSASSDKKAQSSSCSHCQPATDTAPSSSSSSSAACSCSAQYNGYVLLLRLFQAESVFRRLELSTSKRSSKEDQALLALIRKLLAFFQHTPDDRLDNPFMQQLTHAAAEPATARIASASPSSSPSSPRSPAPALSLSLSSLSTPVPVSSSESAASASSPDAQSEPPRPAFRRSVVSPAERQRQRWRRQQQEEAARAAYHHKRKELRFLLTGVRGELPGGLQRQPLPSPQKAKHKSKDDSTALVTAAAGGAAGGAKAEAARKSSIEDLLRGMQDKERQRRSDTKEANKLQYPKDSREQKDAPSSPAAVAPPPPVAIAAPASAAAAEQDDEEGEDEDADDDDGAAAVSASAGGDERARRVKDKRAKKKEKAKQQKRKAVKAAKTRSERAQVDYKAVAEPEQPVATLEEEESLEQRRKDEQEEQEAERQEAARAAAAAEAEKAALEAQRELEQAEKARQQKLEKLEEEHRRLQQEKAEKEREEAEREKERKALRLQEEETQRLEKQRKQQEKAEAKAREEKRRQEEAREREKQRQEKEEAEQAAAALAHQHRPVHPCRFSLCPHHHSITAADLFVLLTCTARCRVRFHHSAPTSPSRSQLSCWQLLPSSSSPAAPSLASLLADGAVLPCPTPDCDGLVRDVSVRRGEDDSVVSQLLQAPPAVKKAAEQEKETKAQRKQRRAAERLKQEREEERRRREFAREERKEDAAAAGPPVVVAVEETRKAVRGFEVVVHAKEKDLVPVIPRPALFSAAADETKESKLPSSPSSSSAGSSSGSAAAAPHRSEKKGRQARLTRIDIFLPEAEPEEQQEPEEAAAVQQQQQPQPAVTGYPVQVSSTAYGGVVRCLPSGSSSRLLYIRSLDASSHPDADVEALSSWIVSQCSLIAPVFVTRFYAPTAVLVQYANTAQAERTYAAFRECMAMQFAAEPASIISSDEIRQAAAYQAVIANKQRQETEAAQRSARPPVTPTLPYRPQAPAARSAAVLVTTSTATPPASLTTADKCGHSVSAAATAAADYAELDAEQFDFSFLGIGGEDDDAVDAACSETPSPPMSEPVAVPAAPDRPQLLPTHSFTSFSSSWSASPSQSSSSAWASPSHTPGQSSAFPSLPSMSAVFSPLQSSAATPPASSSSSSLFSPSSPASKAPPSSSLTPALDPILSPASSSSASSLFPPSSPDLASSSSLRASVSIRTPYFSSSSLFSSSSSAPAESPSSSLFSLPSFSMFAASSSSTTAAASSSEQQTASALPAAAVSFFSSSAAASSPSQKHLTAPSQVLAAGHGDEDDDDVWGDEKLSRLILKSDAEDDDDAQLAGVPTHPRHDSIADSTDGQLERAADDDGSDVRTNSDSPTRYDDELDADFSAQREAEQRAAADDEELISSSGSQSFVRESSGDYDDRHLRPHFSQPQPQQRQASPSPLPPRFSRPAYPPPQGLMFSQQPPPRLPHPHPSYAAHPPAAAVSMEQPAMYGVNGGAYGGWSGAMPSSPQPLPAGYPAPPHVPYGFPAVYGGGGSMYSGYSNGASVGVGVAYPMQAQQSYPSPLMHPHYVQMMLARQMLARGRVAAPPQPALAAAAGKGQPAHAGGGIAMLEMNGEHRQLSGGGQYAPQQQQEDESERWQAGKRGFVVDLEADFPSLAAVTQPPSQPPSHSRQTSGLSSPSSAQSGAAPLLADEPTADSAASASSPSSAGGSEAGVSWTNHIASKLKSRHDPRSAHTAPAAVSPSSAHHDGLSSPAKASPSHRSQAQSQSPSQQQAAAAGGSSSWPPSSVQPRRADAEAEGGHHRAELKGDKRRTPSKGGAGGSEWTEVVAAGKKKKK